MVLVNFIGLVLVWLQYIVIRFWVSIWLYKLALYTFWPTAYVGGRCPWLCAVIPALTHSLSFRTYQFITQNIKWVFINISWRSLCEIKVQRCIAVHCCLARFSYRRVGDTMFVTLNPVIGYVSCSCSLLSVKRYLCFHIHILVPVCFTVCSYIRTAANILWGAL